jgi:hypothetical protein
MDPIILAGLFLLAAFAFLGMVFFIVLYIFDPKQRRQRLLREKARMDYHNARGTAHLIMLSEAQGRIKLKLQTTTKELAENQAVLMKLQTEQSIELHKLIETKIIREHIHQIPGIGPKLGARIASQVFHSRLSDLKSAGRIRGIGDSRQIQINNWIRSWESQIPELLKMDFPGKQQVITNYADRIRSKSADIRKLEKQKGDLQTNYEKCIGLIQQLKEVRARDFEGSLSGKIQSNPKIQFYLNGVFPEWEPMPVWFKEIVSEN